MLINIADILLEKKVTYLLGAGASAPFFSSLGAFEDLLTHPNIGESERKFIKILFYLASIQKNQQLVHNNSNDSDKSFIMDEYQHFLHNNIEYLKNNNSRLSPRRNTIMTTNYDLFLEQAAEKLNHSNSRVFINDGSSGFFTRYFDTDNFNKAMLHRGIDDNYSLEIPTLNIIKCHGSVNWEKSQNNHIKIMNNNFSFLKINKKLEEKKSKLSVPSEWEEQEGILSEQLINDFFESIYKLERYEKLVEKEQTEEFDNIINKILSFVSANNHIIKHVYSDISNLQIVWPTKKKFESTLINQNYYEMLRLLSYELETTQRVLIVFGFSFYDEHITNIVKRSLNNPGLLVVIFSYNEDSKKNIMKQFNLESHIIPNNMKFISPANFLKHNVDPDNADETEYLVIKNHDDIAFYDKRLSKQSNDDMDEAVIDFKAFNQLLSTEVTNKYSYSDEEESTNDR